MKPLAGFRGQSRLWVISMNDQQKNILKMIKKEKKKRAPDKVLLRGLVRDLSSFDKRVTKVNNSYTKGSRSPSFGVWKDDS